MEITPIIISILEQLSKLNPQSLINLVYIILFSSIIYFFTPLLLKVLKSFNIIQDPNVKELKLINIKLSDMIESHENSSITLLNMIKVISDKQNAYLTNEQVAIITKITFKYLERDIIIKLLDIQEDNVDHNNGLRYDMENCIKNLVHDADRYYFKLPNTKGKVVTTDEKIKSFFTKNEEGKTTIDILIEIVLSDKSVNQKKNSIKHELNKLFDTWYRVDDSYKSSK